MKLIFHKINFKIKKWVSEILLKRFLIPIILSCIYILLVGPTSLMAKIFFKNKLDRRNKSEKSNWHLTTELELTKEDLKSQS